MNNFKEENGIEYRWLILSLCQGWCLVYRKQAFKTNINLTSSFRGHQHSLSWKIKRWCAIAQSCKWYQSTYNVDFVFLAMNSSCWYSHCFPRLMSNSDRWFPTGVSVPRERGNRRGCKDHWGRGEATMHNRANDINLLPLEISIM